MARFLLNVFRKTKNEKIIDKGRDCYDNKQLLDYRIEKTQKKGKTIFEMEGKFNGSVDVYKPSINFTKDELIDYHCNCIYYNLNKSICKHIVAMAFEGNNFLEGLETEKEREIIEYFRKEKTPKEKIGLDADLWIVNKNDTESSVDIDLTLLIGGRKYKLNEKISEFLENYEENSMRFGALYTYDPQREYFIGWEKEFLDSLKEIYEFYTSNNQREEFSIEKIFERKKSAERLLNILEKNEQINIKKEKLEKLIKVDLDYYNEKINITFSEPIKYLSMGYSYIGYRDIIDVKIYKVSPEKLEEFREFERIMKLKNWNLSLKEEHLKDIVNKISRFAKVNISKRLKERVYKPKLMDVGIFIDSNAKKGIELTIKKLYDGKEKKNIDKLIILDKESDKEIETKDIVKILENYRFFKDNEKYVLDNHDKIYLFVKEGIPKLNMKYKIFYSKDFKLRKYETVSYCASTKITDLFEINFEIDGIAKEEILGVLKAVKEKKKYYILKNGDILFLGENKNMEEFSELLEKTEAKRDEILSGKIKRERNYGYFLAKFLNRLTSMEKTKNLETVYKKIIQCKEKNNNPDIDKNFPILREYQKLGLQWLLFLRELGMGGILADDMGLGKTLQIISYFSAIEEQKGLKLVIAPKALMYNWRNEFKKFAPHLSVKIIEGEIAARKRKIENSKPGDILISTYGFLNKDMDFYKDISIDTLVIDEAQNIKNYMSKTASCVKEIKADIRIALTGTPIENNALELWSIFDFVFPGYLGKHIKFKRQYRNDLKSLKEVIAPFILRRLKREVLSELPDKIETDIIVELGTEEKKLYLAYLKKYKREIASEKNSLKIFLYITRLRQLCNHPQLFLEDYSGKSSKLEALLELLEECKSGGHRVLVFSQFTEMLEIIKKNMPENMTYLYLDGKTKAKERIELVENFNSGNEDVFIISLKAGGSGLNITGADTVIHFDPWWNSSVEDQATARAYRLGQKKNVNVFKMVAKGTIEEKINTIKEGKEELIREILDQNEELSVLSKKEILKLLYVK